MRGQVHHQPTTGVRVRWPRGRTLLSAGGRLWCWWVGVTGVGERPPVAHHPIGQQPFWWRQGEVSDGGRAEEEGQLRTVTHPLVTEGQARPHTLVRWCVVKYVHPHVGARCHAGACRPPRWTQEDVVGDDLRTELTLMKEGIEPTMNHRLDEFSS